MSFQDPELWPPPAGQAELAAQLCRERGREGMLAGRLLWSFRDPQSRASARRPALTQLPAQGMQTRVGLAGGLRGIWSPGKRARQLRPGSVKQRYGQPLDLQQLSETAAWDWIETGSPVEQTQPVQEALPVPPHVAWL